MRLRCKNNYMPSPSNPFPSSSLSSADQFDSTAGTNIAAFLRYRQTEKADKPYLRIILKSSYKHMCKLRRKSIMNKQYY